MSDADPAVTPGTNAVPESAAPPAGVPTGPNLEIRTWDTVSEPGSYVCNDTGRLLRVPAAALKDGRTPVIEILGPRGPSRVTRLSEDPGLPLADLRLKATAASIPPQF